MSELFALAMKDLRLLVRDKTGFFFAFFWPLLVALIFGAIYSGDADSGSRFRVCITDADNTETSRAFVEELRKAGEIDLDATSLAEARDAVRSGEAAAFVLLEEGFGAAYGDVLSDSPPHIRMGVDPSRRSETPVLRGRLLGMATERFAKLPDAIQQRLEEKMPPPQAPGQSPPAPPPGAPVQTPTAAPAAMAPPKLFEGEPPAFAPMEITEESIAPLHEEQPPNGFAVSFPLGIMWGALGCTAAFSISMVTERARGTLIRLRTAPFGRWRILAGKALACFATTLLLSLGLVVLGYFAFGVRPTSIPLLAAAVVCVAVCFVGLMMLLSVLGKTERAAGGIGWAVLLVMALFGGGMIPVYVMPPWMVQLGQFSPARWALLALEGAVWRGLGPEAMLLPCGILLAAGAAAFAGGAALFRWSS